MSKRNISKTIQYILSGDFLRQVFVRENIIVILLVFFTLFGVIALNFMAMAKQKKVDELQKKIQITQGQLFTLQNEYTEMTRESVISEKLQQYNKKIHTSTTPSIRIE